LVAELKKLAKEAETVWLATDEDREGEAISWHLYETLGLAKKETKRTEFDDNDVDSYQFSPSLGAYIPGISSENINFKNT
jgi:hypothetical protein